MHVVWKSGSIFYGHVDHFGILNIFMCDNLFQDRLLNLLSLLGSIGERIGELEDPYLLLHWIIFPFILKLTLILLLTISVPLWHQKCQDLCLLFS